MRKSRLLRLIWVYAGILAILIGRLVQLQIVDHELWAERARRSRLEKRTIPAERGSILDRNGQVLAEDRRSYDLMFEYRAFRRGQIAGQLFEAFALMGRPCGGLDQCQERAEELAQEFLSWRPEQLELLGSRARGDLLFYLRRLGGIPGRRSQELREWASQGTQAFGEAFPGAQARFLEQLKHGRRRLDSLEQILGARLEEPLMVTLEEERRQLEWTIRQRALTTAAANALGLSRGLVGELLSSEGEAGFDLDHQARRYLALSRLSRRWQWPEGLSALATLLVGRGDTPIGLEDFGRLLQQVEQSQPEDVRGLRRNMAAQVHADRVARLVRRVDFEIVDRIGQDPEGYAGLLVEANPVRVYPGSIAPQLVGQVRMAAEDDLRAFLDQRDELRELARLLERSPEQEKRYRALRSRFYRTTLQPGDTRGLSGIEASFQSVLTGERGFLRTLAGGEEGNAPRELEFVAPRRGSDVRLSLDARLVGAAEGAILQAYRNARNEVKAEQANALELLRSPKVGFALIDLRDGSVPMLATWPTYTHQDLAEHYQELVDDHDANVFRHRALGGGFRGYQVPYPGSTFKVVVAAEALARDPQAWNAKVYCGGSYVPPALANSLSARAMKCNNHAWGELDMRRALKVSCNTYFYTLGQKLGWEALWTRSTALGFGRPTGLELVAVTTRTLGAGIETEAPGDSGLRYRASGANAFLVAGANHLKSRFDDFNAYTLSHFGIGQAIVTASPLQMARFYGWVASGDLLTPRLVLDGGGAAPAVPPEAAVPLDPLSRKRLHEALRAVTEEVGGTAHHPVYALQDFKVAGKTGTAQPTLMHPTHAWFAGYFPWDNPRYSFAILCENVDLHGGQVAALVLHEFLQSEGVQAILFDAGVQ